MLTLLERIIFVIAAISTLITAGWVVRRIILIIKRGQGEIEWREATRQLLPTMLNTIVLAPVWRMRFWTSLTHAFVAWGFLFYLLVNIGDVMEGFIPNFHFFGMGMLGDLYRLGADVFSVGVLSGMLALIVRRLIIKPREMFTRETTLLHPKAIKGIQRDSLIVGTFIIFHVGARFLGESFQLAASSDLWQPFASGVSIIWGGWNETTILIAEHAAFWGALGSIMLFIPYFLYSKHIHLIMTPINILLAPQRRSMGELDSLDFDDETIEQFGATHLEHLGWSQILDAYACIMCNRCQQVCPAYNTGKILSPAALEINKRYFINGEGARLAAGEDSSIPLVEFAITPEAVWACTACGACTDICPVGNDPMRDIIDIRRALVLMENSFPEQLQSAFRGMERTVNPWGITPQERMKWADGIDVATIEQNPNPEYLWWVGCAGATDERAQKVSRSFAEILNIAGVNYAVLGQKEICTGDSARRAGNEYLFYELATTNVALLNEVSPSKIVTTCPHCLHTLKNEYPAFGGDYEVIHHTELINDLIANDNIPIQSGIPGRVTYHDPCYLGRQNQIVDPPRNVIDRVSQDRIEMVRSYRKSSCCGAGGAQMWKEEEPGEQRVSENRILEAQSTGANVLAVGCPFCMIMLSDAAKDKSTELAIKDITEIISENISKKPKPK